MNKSKFIRRLAQKGYTVKASAIIVDDVIDTITEILSEGESVHIYGFGEFKAIDRKERRIKCVNSGESVSIPSIKVPKFEPGQTLRRAVRGL